MIERELNAADFFIVLLSGESIGSDMVVYEVELAYELYKKPDRKFTILPILVDHQEKLPYRLAAKLHRIQHTVWTLEITFDTVAAQILTAIQRIDSQPIDGNTTEKQTPGVVSPRKEAKPTEPQIIPKPKWADIHGNDQYGTYADFSIKGVVQRMRLFLPGRFKMGSPTNEKERWDHETLHEVRLFVIFLIQWE